MTANLSRRTVALVLATLAIALAVTRDDAAVLAEPTDPMVDHDGDMLPDALEWVTLSSPRLSDSDTDGVDDFLEAVLFEVPGASATAPAADHELRVALTGVPQAGGRTEIWLVLMLRFADGTTGTVTRFDPYIDRWGTQLSLIPLIGCDDCRLAERDTPDQGKYLLFQTRFAYESQIRPLLPFTIGVRMTIGGKDISVGNYLLDTEGVTTTLVPLSSNTFAIQTLTQDGTNNNAFWGSDRYCRYELDIIGSTPQGNWAEVRKGTCTSGGGLRCPTTCRSSTGSLVFFPDGMGSVTGG